MTTAAVSFNPSLTTVGNGLFAGASASGLVQGTAFQDPSTRNQLRTGQLASAESLPMWGGVGLYAFVPGGAGLPNPSLGPTMGRATNTTGTYSLWGFSVFDQAYGMVNTPQSPVPLAGTYGQVLGYRMGSGARLVVACDPALVNLRGANLTASVAWDFVNQLLIPYTGTLTVSSGTYTGGSGLVSLTTSAPHGLAPGDTIIVSGATAGTGSYASINGTYTLAAGTTGSTLNYVIATGLTMTINTASATSGPALSTVSTNFQVLDVQSSGCQTVSYNATTGYAVWNYNGSAAVIQI